MKLRRKHARAGGLPKGGTPTISVAGFTMVEIAIALGIIGFALVAIIGILPAGLQVQRDNREDTIINQEGTYFMEAIRNGAQDMSHLEGLIEFVEVREITNKVTVATVSTNADSLVSYLSRPSDLGLRPNEQPLEVRAIMRPSAGAAADTSEVGFRYQLIVRNVAFTNAAVANFQSPLVATTFLPNHLREVRLEFRWPVLPGDKVGTGRQVFRSLVSGTLVRHQTDEDRWLFRQ
jgi:type II secretory pathway pseudopilin PulG